MSRVRTILAGVLVFVVLGGDAGCGGDPCMHPETLQLSVHAATRLNPDPAGHSLPTVLRWFQLETAEQAVAPSFNELWAAGDGDASPVLGKVLASQEFQTFPGKTQVLTLPFQPAARYLLVAAMFRKPEGDRWRELFLLQGPRNGVVCPSTDLSIELIGSRLFTRDRHLRAPAAEPPKVSQTPASTTAALTADNDLGLRFDPEQTRWDSLLRKFLKPDEFAVFHLSYLGNTRVESSQRATFSSLHTTAGSDMRASYGMGQLTIEAHLDQLAQLHADDLKRLEVENLGDMRTRGRATYYWFRLMQGKPITEAQRALIGLNARLAGNLASLVRSEAWVTIANSYGPAFEQSTGIDGPAVLDMARTMLLDRREHRVAFQERYSKLHGEPFRPGQRNRARMAAAAEAVVRIAPKLSPVLRSLGGNRGAAESLGHYLGVGDFSENVHGWYTRAAQSVTGWPRFVELLSRIDPVTTRMRHARDVSLALAALSGTQLEGIDRARMAARLARQFHVAPGRALGFFFKGGDAHKPRYASESALRKALDEYLVDVVERQWSDTRLIHALDDIIEKRSSDGVASPSAKR